MLDTFYRDTKNLEYYFSFMFNKVLLPLRLCDNTNIITRKWSITGFKQRSTDLKFDTEILHPEKCFVESTKISIGPYLNEKLC